MKKKFLALALVGAMVIGGTTVSARTTLTGSYKTSGGTSGGVTTGIYYVGVEGSAYDQGVMSLTAGHNCNLYIKSISLFSSSGIQETDSASATSSKSVSWHSNTYKPDSITTMTCTFKNSSTLYGSWSAAKSVNF